MQASRVCDLKRSAWFTKTKWYVTEGSDASPARHRHDQLPVLQANHALIRANAALGEHVHREPIGGLGRTCGLLLMVSNKAETWLRFKSKSAFLTPWTFRV